MSSSVSIRRLHKAFDTRDGAVKALRDVSLEVAGGEFIAVIGQSGCGKSTLLRMVAGLIAPTQGEVVVDGRSIRGTPFTDVGFVFQDAVLFDWKTVLDNILLQVRVRGLDRQTGRRRAELLLEKVGLKGFEGRRPYELSGGMRQRVAVCRALVHDPPLLLMDEPFGALDALTREQMTTDLESMWLERQPTVLFVTHSIPEATLLADRIIVMSSRPGTIIGEVAIDLPRPRVLADVGSDPRFIGPTQKVRRLLNLDVRPVHAEL